MKRRVLFIGNCQFIVLAKLYERFGGRTSSETVNVLPSYELLTDESREAVAGADLIVEQRVDMAPQADVGGVVTRAERHFVPLLAGGFLWPFAGQPHPCNETPWFLTAGPWNAELADGYLNRLLLQSVPPDEAIQQYLNLDVAKVRDLDRTLELILDRQRARDAACGYDIASVVEDRFRQELMFLTPHHPGLRVTLTAAAQFFEHMGVARQAADRMAEQTLVSPFPTDGLPIHPSVARHFGLAYGHEGERYRHLYEGSFTFAEYVARYVRNEWNRDLAEGLANAGASPELALSQLEIALQTSPGSAEAHFVKGDLLRRLGRSAEAEAPTRRAIELAPEKPSYRSGLAHLLTGAGRQEEAFEEMSEATRLDPFDPHFLGMRALLALRTNRPADAEADARLLLELEPANAFGCQMLGEALLRLDDPLAAAEQFREAARIEPENQGHLASLGEALAAAGRASGLPEPSRLRWSAAKKTGMEARRADPAGDPRQFAMLDVVLATLRGDAAQARQAMREVFALAEPTLSQDDWMFENLLGTACACELFEFATNILNVRFRERWCSGVGVLAEAPDALAVRWTVQDGGTCRFDMFPALYDVDDTIESTLHWSRWLSLFHHYVRSAAPVRGHTDINLFDVGLTPGISCCDDKPGYFLVPDPVFIASRGYADLRGEFEAADVPWADRIPQAFWRGSTTGNHQDELERLPRLRLCRLARSPESRGLLDAAITSVVQLTADWAEKVMQSGLMGSPVPQTDYLRYKYQVDIDGNSNAWAGLYERLLTGSPVLKVASPSDYRQWYYDRLVPWWNFIPVQSDMSDLVDKIRWLQRNDELARQIGERGKTLALSLEFESEQVQAAPTLSAALRSAAGLPLVEARLGSESPQGVRLLKGWMGPAAGERRVVGYESRLEMRAPMVRGALTLRLGARALAEEPCRLTVIVNGDLLWQGAVSGRASVACQVGEDVRSRSNPLSIQLLHDRSFPALPEDGAQPMALGLAFNEVSLLLGAAP